MMLDKVVNVLRCFTSDAPDLSVTEATARLALPKSTISRLLAQMMDAGLLEPVDGTRRYRPSALLFSIGGLYRAGSDLITRLDATLPPVVERFGHSGYVSVLDRTEIVAIRATPGRNLLRVSMPVGYRMPAFATAVGRSLLSRFTDDDVRALHRGGVKPVSPTSPQSLDDLLARLHEVRDRGWATAEDEANPGVGTVAASVREPRSGEMAAACVSFPLALVPAAEREEIRALLVAAVEAAGGEIGDPFWIGRLGDPSERRAEHPKQWRNRA